jgi:hypothetical protein
MPQLGIDLNDIKKITPKKKRINSKSKGKTGEYYFANFLTELTGKKYMKVPNSGAILGASNQQKVLQLTAGVANVFLGDLIPPADMQYKQIFECKNYAKFAFNKLKTHKTNSQIKQWLDQLLHECVTYSMTNDSRLVMPLLFIKITGIGSWVVYNVQYMQTLFPTISLEKEFEIIHTSPLPGLGNVFYMADFKSWITKNKDLLFQ